MEIIEREKLDKAYYYAVIAEQNIKTKLVWSWDENSTKTQYICDFLSSSGKALVKIWGEGEKNIRVDDVANRSSSIVWMKEMYLDKGKHRIVIDTIATKGLAVEIEVRNGKYDNKS